jgi:Predicted O-linked N-acetylglucosamine transferase, SPINDLY family
MESLSQLAARGLLSELSQQAHQQINQTQDVNQLLELGAVVFAAGLLALAKTAFQKAGLLASEDFRYAVNLANVYREQGNHQAALALHQSLIQQHPNHPIIRRNFLTSLEYDLHINDTQRFSAATDWGNWAVIQAGGIETRPPIMPLDNPQGSRALRIGYVSADLCQHTVGWLLLPVIQQHTTKVEVYTYHAGAQQDSITEHIKTHSHYRHVHKLTDTQIAVQIKSDKIDVLIDLSGHTAGSRLTVFAHRPAPVQISWLGYFASTGLNSIDAVLLDDDHITPATQAYFTETIIALPNRWCYHPVPFAPQVSEAPHQRNGYITFGSFNNTAKYNPQVFNTWAEILTALPNSRLILKWRTYNDDTLKTQTLTHFQQHGIETNRIQLRPASFHANLLAEYSDIDIALDPFPFTGGMTSLEALWMGVPIITHPMSRVVSRQTHAILNQIGLAELSADTIDEYIQTAINLARDPNKINTLRQSMRQRMQASNLMNATAFTQNLESTLINLYTQQEQSMTALSHNKKVLHIGPGHKNNGASLPKGFQTADWQEVRYDIDPNNEPDLIGDMLNMQAVATGSMDAIYSSHNIEHIYPHQVAQFLAECTRVLKEDGIAVITCPDLQTIAMHIANDNLTDPLYQSPAGPITPLDILYGHSAALAAGHHYMAHKGGFTLKTLTKALQQAGFSMVAGKRRLQQFDLWVLASKHPMPEVQIRALAEQMLPA